ncbi:MAG: restriction endonuclease subunit S, partial [Gammaproteobacteria bacterium]|nr:restriction endonuclease subunit S [Gammaproteobacteria bacterium]
MTTDNPSPLVPKLRFPEFRDDPPWSAPLLSDLYDFKRTNTLSRDKLNYETGTIRNIHYGDIHTRFKPLFQVREERVPYINPDSSVNEIDDDALCQEGDIVLADASEDLNDVGKAIEVVSLGGERVVAGTHTILGTRRGNVPVVGFSGQLFQCAAVRAGIKKEAHGSKVYGISAKRIAAVPIPIPPTVAEQAKIADCLGSLDDLIAAAGQKLEALRQHKQGLLLQLFPQPGETVPKLRFPEFRDDPPWSAP